MKSLKTLDNYTKKDVMEMDYNNLIALIRETNRPPGGINALVSIAQKTFLNKDKRVLEIGTSTGFTAIELAKLTGCNISAIDINETSLEEAKIRAQKNEVENKIKFIKANAIKTDFNDKEFDVVFCGNVTSLISNREKALAEYCRVLKDGGYLVSLPMYYLKAPPKELVSKVSQAIQVNITPLYKDYWINFFDQKPLQIFFQEDYKFDYINDLAIDQFSTQILLSSHLKEMNETIKTVLSKRYREFMFLFRDNLEKMGYTILILRKEVNIFDPELFTSRKVRE